MRKINETSDFRGVHRLKNKRF